MTDNVIMVMMMICLCFKMIQHVKSYDENNTESIFISIVSVWSFMKFSGQRPTVNEGNGFKTQGRSSVDGCSFQCIKDEVVKCKSFGIRQKGYDEKHGVNAQVC